MFRGVKHYNSMHQSAVQGLINYWSCQGESGVYVVGSTLASSSGTDWLRLKLCAVGIRRSRWMTRHFAWLMLPNFLPTRSPLVHHAVRYGLVVPTPYTSVSTLSSLAAILRPHYTSPVPAISYINAFRLHTPDIKLDKHLSDRIMLAGSTDTFYGLSSLPGGRVRPYQ